MAMAEALEGETEETRLVRQHVKARTSSSSCSFTLFLASSFISPSIPFLV